MVQFSSELRFAGAGACPSRRHISLKICGDLCAAILLITNQLGVGQCRFKLCRFFCIATHLIAGEKRSRHCADKEQQHPRIEQAHRVAQYTTHSIRAMPDR